MKVDFLYSDDFYGMNSKELSHTCMHLLCTSGEGSFVFNEHCYHIAKNDLVVIPYPNRVNNLAAHMFLLLILDDVDAAKGYHTTEEGSVLRGLNIILVDDTERSLIAVPDGIYLMTAQCAVEIHLALGIDIADGNGVWIAAIAQQCQCASSRLLQDPDALFF